MYDLLDIELGGQLQLGRKAYIYNLIYTWNQCRTSFISDDIILQQRDNISHISVDLRLLSGLSSGLHQEMASLAHQAIVSFECAAQHEEMAAHHFKDSLLTSSNITVLHPRWNLLASSRVFCIGPEDPVQECGRRSSLE